MAENVISLSSDAASMLYLAYCGLSDVRRTAVDESVKTDKISRNQATFNEICVPRVELYAKRGKENQVEIMNKALQLLLSTGMKEDDARKALGLSLPVAAVVSNAIVGVNPTK